jgi:hypothetical protein
MVGQAVVTMLLIFRIPWRVIRVIMVIGDDVRARPPWGVEVKALKHSISI